MEIDLGNIGINKGQQYETIITTVDENGLRNAAPIGVICKSRNTVMSRIFKGSKTLENILSQKEYTVNISHDETLFTLATLGNIQESYFAENNSIKGCEAYFRCKVTDLIEAVKRSDPIRKSEAIVIKADVVDLTINKKCNAMNRGFGMLIETLVNFTRIDIADEKTRNYYLDRFKEANRIINKVGSAKEKESMKEIKKELKNKGLID